MRATASVRGTSAPAPCWGRVPGVYRSRAVAYLPDGRTLALGEARPNSPRLAMRWLRKRAEQLAEQLDAPYARPVRGWIADTVEHGWALAGLTQGHTYVFRVTDDEGTLYLLTAEPAALTAIPRPC